MSFSDSDDEVVYIIVSINISVGQDMDSGHYYCNVLYYNTGTWCICDDEKRTNYRGYRKNFYDESLHENKQKQRKSHILIGLDRIMSMLYIKRDIIAYITY